MHNQKNCDPIPRAPVIISPPSNPKRPEELIALLSESSVESKSRALEELIASAAENCSALRDCVIPVIKHCFSSQDKRIKRLFLLFWEVYWAFSVNNPSSDETLLVCNELLQNLSHPNEYIVGATLRLLCSFREENIVLMAKQAVTRNLEHESAYIRRQSVLTLLSLETAGEEILPSSADFVLEMLEKEKDEITRRNCFLLLQKTSRDKALLFLGSISDELLKESNFLQLQILDFIKELSSELSAFSLLKKCVISLLDSSDQAVSFQAAASLLQGHHFKASSTQINQSFRILIKILSAATDSNAKHFVLERLKYLQTLHPSEFSSLTSLFCNSIPLDNSALRKISLSVLVDLATPTRQCEILSYLKSSTQKTRDKQCKTELIDAICQIGAISSETAAETMPFVLRLLGQNDLFGSKALVAFLRKASDVEGGLSDAAVQNLIGNFGLITHPSVLKILVWAIGEHALSKEAILRSFDLFCSQKFAEKIILNSDLEEKSEALSLEKKLLLSGLSTALIKLFLRLQKQLKSSKKEDLAIYNRKTAAVLKTLTAIHSKYSSSDKTLSEAVSRAISVILKNKQNPNRFESFYFPNHKDISLTRSTQNHPKPPKTQNVNSLISIPSITERSPEKLLLFGNPQPPPPHSAPPQIHSPGLDDLLPKLRRVKQLTGCHNPLYVEATLRVEGFDAFVDYAVYNTTSAAIKNISIEIYSAGSIRVLSCQSLAALNPSQCGHIEGHLKVFSTEGGDILGFLKYSKSPSKSALLAMNPLSLSAEDFLRPAECSFSEFTEKWAEFEWENKVSLRGKPAGLGEALDAVRRAANAQCLTPSRLRSGRGDFLSANLFSRSLFLDEVLLNVSLEESGEAVSGVVRVRCQTKEIARSLGDLIEAL